MSLPRRLEDAQRATPGVSAQVEGFATALRERLKNAVDAERELAELHVEDLYLAWALEQGDKAAFARFEREFLSQLAVQIKGAAAEAGELEQLVRTRLFVPSEGQAARITQYSGRGPFGGWLRMIATRCLLDLQRARTGHKARELDSPSVPTDPELDYLKLRYASEFKQALETALGQLDARQITLLKLSFIEQVPASVIGVMYKVSGRTVQRWLAELRETLLTATRENLRSRLGLSPSELDSLLGLVDSQLQAACIGCWASLQLVKSFVRKAKSVSRRAGDPVNELRHRIGRNFSAKDPVLARPSRTAAGRRRCLRKHAEDGQQRHTPNEFERG